MKRGLAPIIATRLAALYKRMDEAYTASSASLGLSCEGCSDNCCETFFQHHTYVEWAYLWEGLRALPQATQQSIAQASEDWVRRHQNPILPGVRPRVMCPLNLGEEGQGRCGLYAHRLMVCRLHGVPNELIRPAGPRNPSGQRAAFPGCERAQELGKTCTPLVLDRTPLLTELARLEMDFVGRERMRKLPRVDLTLAEMILAGPPKI